MLRIKKLKRLWEKQSNVAPNTKVVEQQRIRFRAQFIFDLKIEVKFTAEKNVCQLMEKNPDFTAHPT